MNLLRHSRIITTKTTTNKWRRPMMIVIVFGEREEKNSRGETNISKVNQWRTSCSMRTKQRRNKANKDNQCMAEYTHVLFSLASAKTLARRSRGVGGLCKMYATLLCVFRFAVFFLVRDGLYRNPCVSVCYCVLRFENSQRNLYLGQPGASYWSAAYNGSL